MIRSGSVPALSVGIIALGGLYAWASRSQYLYEGDSVGFAFGMHEFAVDKDQPHAPGYPLWILTARLLDRTLGDPNTSQILLAIAFALAAAFVFDHSARRRVGEARAVALTALFVASPGFLFHAATATTYAVDLLASTALGALAARAWQGSFRHALLGVVLSAGCAGYRQSGAVLMLPLVLVAAMRAAATWRHYLVAAVAGGLTFAAWYVPLALLHGGVRAFQRLTSRRILQFLGDTSALFGAPANVHAEMALANASGSGCWPLPSPSCGWRSPSLAAAVTLRHPGASHHRRSATGDSWRSRPFRTCFTSF